MITSFIIGLSFLSSDRDLQRAQARRILSEIEGKPLNEAEILKEEGGRPYFAGRHCDFNISHSGNMAAVSVVYGGCKTGCDIQIVKSKTNTLKIAEKVFSAAEREYIKKDRARFFEIWALKECYLKLRGFSVFDMPKAPCFIRNNEFCLEGEYAALPLSFYLYELSGGGARYMLAAAIEGGGINPETRWFSTSVLPCKSIAEIKAPARAP
jgi:phosphopantetheinyl transferase